MNKFVVISILILIAVFTYLMVDYHFMIFHEDAHYQIAKQHGCLEGKVNLGGFLGFKRGNFKCLDYQERSDEIITQERKLHALNEIIGYNISVITEAIIFSALLVGIALVLVKNA